MITLLTLQSQEPFNRFTSRTSLKHNITPQHSNTSLNTPLKYDQTWVAIRDFFSPTSKMIRNLGPRSARHFRVSVGRGAYWIPAERRCGMMKARRSESAVGVDDVSNSGAGSIVEEMFNHEIVKYKTESPPLRYRLEKAFATRHRHGHYAYLLQRLKM